MSLYRIVLALVVTTLFCSGQAGAQERTVRVGVPAGPLVQLDPVAWIAWRTDAAHPIPLV
jgi:hypothetical protein